LVATILLEFVVTVVPMMVFSLATMFSALSWFHAKEFIHKHCRKEKMNQLLEKELPFLTNFRAQIMLST
jgi:hypothetical protein